MTDRRFSACVAACLLTLTGASLPPFPGEDATPASAREILTRALTLRFASATRAEVELIITDPHGAERRRTFEVATKRIDGRLHAVGRLTSPEYLRGMAIMTIENPDRSNDAFVYLPSIGKARRITAAQRSDTFLGSDLTYDDLGPTRMSEYEVALIGPVRSGAETARLIRASPRSPMNYERVEFVVAEDDLAILEARYFKRGRDEPYRSVQAPREWIRTGEGYALPTYLIIENKLRSTTTEVRVRDLAINPKVDDLEFSVLSLEREALAQPR